MPDAVEVRDLADCLDDVPTFAAWLNREWGHHGGLTLADSEARLRGYLNRDRIPLALAAYVGGAPAGIVVLRDHDLASRPDLKPWLSSLFVSPECRRRGVGSALMRAAEARARRIGLDGLYLFTRHQVALYGSLGWEIMGEEEDGGRPTTLMRKVLGGRQ